MKNKTEICVPIRDEAELQQAKDMLEKNGEKIDEKYFNFKFKNIDANWIYLKLDNKGFWYIGKKHTTEIPLSELESVLKGESVEKQSSIEWLVSILNKQGFAPVLTDEEIQQAKQMHLEEIEHAVKFGQNNHSVLVEFNEVKAKNYYTIKFKND